MRLFKESCCCLSVEEQDDGYDEFNDDTMGVATRLELHIKLKNDVEFNRCIRNNSANLHSLFRHQSLCTGDSLLHMAVTYGTFSMVVQLVKFGHDINVENKMKHTPLHLPSPIDTFEYLLAKGSQVNAVCDKFSFSVCLLDYELPLLTPLHIAARCCNGVLDRCELLLMFGADPNIKAGDGSKAVDYIISKEDKATFERHVETYKDVRALNEISAKKHKKILCYSR